MCKARGRAKPMCDCPSRHIGARPYAELGHGGPSASHINNNKGRGRLDRRQRTCPIPNLQGNRPCSIDTSPPRIGHRQFPDCPPSAPRRNPLSASQIWDFCPRHPGKRSRISGKTCRNGGIPIARAGTTDTTGLASPEQAFAKWRRGLGVPPCPGEGISVGSSPTC